VQSHSTYHSHTAHITVQSHITHHSHPLPITVTSVTISKKGNYISSGAHFSGLLEYTSPGSPFIEKNVKYSKNILLKFLVTHSHIHTSPSLHHHTSHISVTPVTISKKGSYISSGAHFSGLPEYTSPVIYGSPSLRKVQNTRKNAALLKKKFAKNGTFSSHLMQNSLAIQNMLDA
jgi:hypothetical protein